VYGDVVWYFGEVVGEVVLLGDLERDRCDVLWVVGYGEVVFDLVDL